jgi:hypothetical protein
MSRGSVISVYGLRQGQDCLERLGEGSLIDEQLVLVTGPLSDILASADPPSVLRVEISSLGEEPGMEVIEVAQTLRSVPNDAGPMWALELASPSAAPLDPLDVGEPFLTAIESGVGNRSAGGRFFCSLWPNASFC